MPMIFVHGPPLFSLRQTETACGRSCRNSYSMIRMQVVVPKIPKCSKMIWRSMARRFQTAKAEWCKSRGERRDFYQVRHPRKRRRTPRTRIFPETQPDWCVRTVKDCRQAICQKEFPKDLAPAGPSLPLLFFYCPKHYIMATKKCRKFMQLIRNQHCSQSGFFQGPFLDLSKGILQRPAQIRKSGAS